MFKKGKVTVAVASGEREVIEGNVSRATLHCDGECQSVWHLAVHESLGLREWCATGVTAQLPYCCRVEWSLTEKSKTGVKKC